MKCAFIYVLVANIAQNLLHYEREVCDAQFQLFQLKNLASNAKVKETIYLLLIFEKLLYATSNSCGAINMQGKKILKQEMI